MGKILPQRPIPTPRSNMDCRQPHAWGMMTLPRKCRDGSWPGMGMSSPDSNAVA